MSGNTSVYTWSCAGTDGGESANCAAIRHYRVSASAGEHGNLSPSEQTVAYNTTAQIDLDPESGYAVDAVNSDCGGSLDGNTYIAGPVSAHCSVTASFVLTNDAIDGSCGDAAGRSLTSAPSDDQLCDTGTPSAVTGNGPWSWTCGGNNGGTEVSCQAEAEAVIAHEVTPSAGTGGALAPDSPQPVNDGDSLTFDVIPDSGYVIDTVSGCAGALTGFDRYATGSVTADCTISASFLPVDIAVGEGEDGDTQLTEGGGTDTLAVTLSAPPQGTVTLAAISLDPNEAELVTAQPLTFTATNWNVPQILTLRGADDWLVDGAQETAIQLAVTVSTAPGYGPSVGTSVMATTLDDDQAGIALTQSDGNTQVSEAGGADTLALKLTAQPLSDVAIAVASEDPDALRLAPASLAFTSQTWDSAQTVTVTGLDDRFVDGTREIAVTAAVVDANSDVAFGGQEQSILVTRIDNDQAGFTLSETDGGTEVGETAGATDQVQAVLNARPRQPVVILVTPDAPNALAVDPQRLPFDSTDWDQPQTVAVAGLDDRIAEGDQVSGLAFAIDPTQSDGDFLGLDPQTLAVTLHDDDTPGMQAEVPVGGLITGEDGTATACGVTLASQPTADVFLSVGVSNPQEGDVSPASLTFAADNWNVRQEVTVTGIDDQAVDGQQAYDVLLTPTSASAAEYVGLDSVRLPATNRDDEPSSAPLAILVSGVPEAGLITTEGAGPASFGVALNAQPTAYVQVSVSSGNPREGTVNSRMLGFTRLNWRTPQTVVVTGVNDRMRDGDRTYAITLQAAGLATVTVPAINEDND